MSMGILLVVVKYTASVNEYEKDAEWRDGIWPSLVQVMILAEVMPDDWSVGLCL